MLVIPAVDIRRGEVVRLSQGDYARETVYEADPVAVARRFADLGARRIHVVDLDAAREGRFTALSQVRAICASVDAEVDMGGGVRSLEMIDEALGAGVDRVVIGTLAHAQPDLLAEACARHPGRLSVSIDCADGFVAVRGWTEVTELSAVELAGRVVEAGVDEVIVTDIARDGMLTGVNLVAAVEVAQVGVDVIAAGGVSSIEDVARAAAAAEREPRLVGVITGRAVYTGDLDLAEALKLAAGEG